MKARVFAVAAAAVLLAAAPSRASLTASETEQVRRGVATASDMGRVRALVARPDLSPDEAATALAAPMTTAALDTAHVAFLHYFVFGDASIASRPVLSVVALRGALARADAVLGQHALDLDRTPLALSELERAYAFVEQMASADASANVPASARAQCARALADHIARNATVLSPQAVVAAVVGPVRAQAAIALLDLMPDAATRRIDAAEGLGLTGARRALLVERGVLALDAGGTEGRIVSLRGLLDRLPSLRDGVEAIVVGSDASGLTARDGAILATGADPGGNAGPTLLWGNDVRSPPADGWTTAVARGFATVAVSRALAKKEAAPRAGRSRRRRPRRSSHDGDARLERTARRRRGGRAPPRRSKRERGVPGRRDRRARRRRGSLPVPTGSAKTAGPAGAAATQLTHVTVDTNGAAKTFRLEGRTWLFEHDAAGAVSGLRRDGVPVTSAMLAAARP